MQFSSILSGLSLFSITSFVAASPVTPQSAGANLVEVAKRQSVDIDQAYSIVQSLYAEVQTYTGSINATAATLSPLSSEADKDAATSSVGDQLNSITAAVNAAAEQINGTAPASSKLMVRQTVTPDQLATLVEDLILDISGALNNIIAQLGLDPLLSFLTPLVGSLSGLLLSLEAVVNQLLALVQQLVDGLLTGLSVGLAGLVL